MDTGVIEISKFKVFRALVHPADEGGFWAEIPEIHALTQGETLVQIQEHMADAAALTVEDEYPKGVDYALAFVVDKNRYKVYQAIAYPDDEGGFWGRIPELHANEQGETLLELQARLNEMAAFCVDYEYPEGLDYLLSMEIQKDPNDYDAIARECYATNARVLRQGSFAAS